MNIKWWYFPLIALIILTGVYMSNVAGSRASIEAVLNTIVGGLGTAIGNLRLSIVTTPFWMNYGTVIVAIVCSVLGGTAVMLYYKGKLSIMRFGIRKAAQEIGYIDRPTYSPTPIPQTGGGEVIPTDKPPLPTLPTKEAET